MHVLCAHCTLAQVCTHTFSNLSGSKMSVGPTGPNVGVKLGVEKMPASPCVGSEVGSVWGDAVVSLVTVSLETDRAEGNTLMSVVGGFGCLVCVTIGWEG